MTETTFGKNRIRRVRGVYDLYCSQPTGGDGDVLALLLGGCVGRLYIQSMTQTSVIFIYGLLL